MDDMENGWSSSSHHTKPPPSQKGRPSKKHLFKSSLPPNLLWSNQVSPPISSDDLCLSIGEIITLGWQYGTCGVLVYEERVYK